MKAKLNLTIDQRLLITIKSFAASNNVSVSELVENYFKQLTQQTGGTNIIDMVEQLPPANIDIAADLKAEYYESKK